MTDDEIRATVKAHTDYRADDFGVDNMCGWCGAHMRGKDARHRDSCGLVEIRRAIVMLGKEALRRGVHPTANIPAKTNDTEDDKTTETT